MSSRRRRILGVALGAAVLLLGFLLYRDGRHGRRVSAHRMTNHDVDFDFGAPPCSPAPRPGNELRVAYLGVGGLLVEWRGSVLVAAPYFTRQGLIETIFGALRVDSEAIARGLAPLDAARWDVVLSGHSHYDHLADLPEVMTRHAPAARLWTNASGARMLAPFPALTSRIHAVEPSLGSWVRPLRDGVPLPFRFMPLPSDHAPHLYGLRYAHGTVEESWDTWDGKTVRSMLDGLTVNFLIDLLDGEEIAFRMFYQGSASPSGVGHPPTDEIERRGVDLAILCAPPYWQVEDYPEGVLAATRAGYVLAIHYEDFLQPADRPLRFVRSLTDTRVDRLLERIEGAIPERGAVVPATPVCGPSAERWSMPLPGEWLGFDLPNDAVLTSSTP
ncbi:MAG: hypothetical protein GTN89_07190 [Acidobacteria bacterium]|nr:hypothetical protein [Acidobacteriota bacterium]NIM62958.1 hypothetical protein [Acidobacteriota bacterium]NIO59112.1 hypothetical protein [Acidobacteriota bacterium]NIQ30143.1 hypothetical protein [Acidobacteriota bacterium]NIQ84981.1 hypothetical protein [Acidobacteriota bacterium]